MTLKRDRRPFSEKSRPRVKKTTKPKALLQKKKQTNPLFEDESCYKITFKRRDFYLQTYLGIKKELLIATELSFPNDFFYFFH